MPGRGGEFESEVSHHSSGIHVVVKGCIGMEKFKGKKVTFVTTWLQRRRLQKLSIFDQGIFEN